MKQANRKKGFSLIELIVVIAVIAAIAAVIVPQFTNITGAARAASDARSAQMWNQVYQDVYSIQNGNKGTTFKGTLPPAAGATYTPTQKVPEINCSVNLNGADMTFVAPEFTIEGETGYTFTVGTGLTLTKAP